MASDDVVISLASSAGHSYVTMRLCCLTPRIFTPRIFGVDEPLSAFGEPELSRWVAYAASPSRRRRLSALEAEYTDACYRA
jgi:hypothetical protein